MEHHVFPGWETIEKLGEGGMCAVYRVRPRAGNGAERAVKVLQNETERAARSFRDEARLLAKIDHPNVLRVHRLHEADPPWILMDLVAGNDLEETRESQGPMEPELAARLFADIASGLAAVHALGMRHRDVKPSNIVVGVDGVPQLIDFGIALEADSAVVDENTLVGTAAYLAPEVFASHGPGAGDRDTEVADVFALGQTLCEVLTGASVYSYEGSAGPAVLYKIMADKAQRGALDPRDWRPSVPDGLAEIVRRATARDPRTRTPSAAQLELQLRQWLDQRKAKASAPLSKAFDPTTAPPPPRHLVVPPPAPAGPEAPPAFPVGSFVAWALVVVLAGSTALLWARPSPGLGACLVPGSQGRVVFAVNGGPAGDRVELVSSTLADPGVEGCLAERISRSPWKGEEPVRIELEVGGGAAARSGAQPR